MRQHESNRIDVQSDILIWTHCDYAPVPCNFISCLNLFQPWADAVIDGRLPVLLRRFSTQHRDKIGIAATEGFDGVFFGLLTDQDLSLAESCLSFGLAIGSVDVVDCYDVSKKSCWKELNRLAGRRAAHFYPAHLIPDSDRVFFWILANPKRFRNPLVLSSKGVSWSKAKTPLKVRHAQVQKNRTFWRLYKPAQYLRLNDEVRIIQGK